MAWLRERREVCLIRVSINFVMFWKSRSYIFLHEGSERSKCREVKGIKNRHKKISPAGIWGRTYVCLSVCLSVCLTALGQKRPVSRKSISIGHRYGCRSNASRPNGLWIKRCATKKLLKYIFEKEND